jgi:antitoxin (DNA-binding transcriptional repressor) of toxin-antitoxin stability system
MQIASVTETKNRLSALLELVRQGETILILDRKRPIARIEPIDPTTLDVEDGRLAALERQGLIERSKNRLPKEFFSQPLPSPKEPTSLFDALIAERREGR